MWANLTLLSLPASNFIVRAVVVYIAILFLLRFSGKRQVGQMSAVEFVVVMLLSNAVQNSMNGGDNSLMGGLLLASVLVAMSWLISNLNFRFKKFRHIVLGVPTLLIHKGTLIEENMKRERIARIDLATLLRKQGIHHFHEVYTAILESDGSLSVTKMVDHLNESARLS